MEEFFAESEDHLRVIREALLALERQPPGPGVDRQLVDELLRSFHSLKGNAGMMGMGAVEQIAHQIEGILRALIGGRAPLTPELLGTLLAATRAVEQLVDAARSQTPPPDTAPLLERIAALGISQEVAPGEPPASDSGRPADGTAEIEAARRRGEQVWSITFTPSAALAERGVNVGQVRGRLAALGTLIRAVPQVRGAQGLAFEFTLAANLDASTISELEGDGMRLVPHAPAEPAALAAPALAAPTPAAPATDTAQLTLRVDLGRLDELLQLVGQLVIVRAQLAGQLDRLEPAIPRADWRALQETSQTLGRRLRDVRAAVVRVRMVPIGEAFARLRFAAHGLARELDRPVAVTLSGQETEIDKYVLERVLDPLMHLVRNAVSHGLEPREARLAAGKPETGTLSLRAATVSDSVVIEVEDDGRGIDTAAVLAKAREQQLLGDGPLGPDDLLDVLCAPGFSTRLVADRISGRGVGLDVVRTGVRSLNGTLSLSTANGRGTTFRIVLPLSLLVMDALLTAVGPQVFAVSLTRVREIVEVDPERVTALDGREIMIHRGRVLPLLRVARRFGLEEAAVPRRYALVVGDAEGADEVGVVVDRLLGKREIVVRPISDVLGRTDGVSGAAEIGDGRPVLIIDVPGLIGRGE